MKEIDVIFIKKLEEYWTEIIKNPNYKRYKITQLITHLSGIHIDFYQRPFIYAKKKKPEIYFSNKILKAMTRLNNIKSKSIYIPKLVINTIIEQCNIIVQNINYWENHGFTKEQSQSITNTYFLFIKYLKKYILDYPQNNCSGLGITKEGNDLYEFILKYVTGMKNISAKELQRFGLLRVNQLIEQIEKRTNKKVKDAYEEYTKSKEFLTSETDLLREIRIDLEKLYNKSKSSLFNKNIIIPKTRKITVRPLPKIKAIYGPLARTFDNIMFINTLHYNNFDKNAVLRICAHETIPGHITERNNTDILINDYYKSTNYDIRKYITRGNIASKEGWAVYSEELIKDLYQVNGINKHELVELYLLFGHLHNALALVIDIGLHSTNCIIQFSNIEDATKYMNNYIYENNEAAIKNKILQMLAKPGFTCAYELGYYCIKKMYKDFKIGQENNMSMKKFNSLFMKLPFTLPLFREYISKRSIFLVHNYVNI